MKGQAQFPSDRGKRDFFIRLIQFLDSPVQTQKRLWPRVETRYWMRETVDLILNYNYSYEEALATVKTRQIGKDCNGHRLEEE